MGGSSPVSWTQPILNDISRVAGTDGGGGGVLGNIENTVEAIGSGKPLDVLSSIAGTDGSGHGLMGALADVDKSVHDIVPGGWAMVGAIALTIMSAGSIDLEPELAAGEVGAEVGGGGVAGGGVGAVGDAGVSTAGGDVFGGLSTTGSNAGYASTVATQAAPTAFQAMVNAAGTGALYGGGIGGVNAAIRGTDPIKGIVMGAVMGGLTAGAANGLTSALVSQGVPAARHPTCQTH